MKKYKKMIRELLIKLISGTQCLVYGRDIIIEFVSQTTSKLDGNLNLLDIGCGDGTDLINIRDRVELSQFGSKKYANKYYGIETEAKNIQAAKQQGIQVLSANIEKDRLPFDNEFFDIVIINQVLEHTKELFFIFGELSRIMKKNAILVVGVPNLASFHNRIALLFGFQPPTIELLSAHIRGFTKNDFKKFVETDGFFELIEYKGSGFYPFPMKMSKLLGKLFPTMAVGSFYKIRRMDKDGNFILILDNFSFETPYKRNFFL